MSMMTYDETEMVGFFGVMPVPQDTEEKEFFGSAGFEVIRGPLVLRISFSHTHSPKVMADISHSGGGAPIVAINVNDAAAVRIDPKAQRLVVLAARPGERSRDPQFEERMTVSLNPLKVVVSD
jgi:hypothetical protein